MPPRCCFKHDAFEQEGFRHDGTDQCWMTDVGEFQISPGVSKYYCVFHKPEQLQSLVRMDWIGDKRGDVQAKQLRELLDEWNEENARREKKGEQTLAFLLPGLQCGNIYLKDYSFSSSVIFDSATFSGDARFDSAIFSGNARFASATFSGYASFSSAIFSGNARFASATFSGYASFSSATFSGHAWFSSAIFSGNAEFNSATFSGHVWFNSATFSHDAWFYSATFSHDAWFSSATFSDNALFNSATFSGSAGFNSATFSQKAWFDSATFNRESTFINTELNSGTKFSDCNFENAPNFHGATLHQSTDFRGTEFKDRTSREAPLAYRTLKLAMGDVHSRQEEAMFYALEQESRRNQSDTPFSVKAFSFLYHRLSNYGQSFVRPLAFLFFVTSFFMVVYAAILPKKGEFLELSEFALQFSIEQIVRPFSVWTAKGIERLQSLDFEGGILLIQGIATVQSLLSIVLITLFLLAVRREFKLG